MSYAGSITETYRLAGLYAGRILRGERYCAGAKQSPQNYPWLVLLNARNCGDLESF